MPKPILRVIDTDIGDGRMHIALGQALIDQHREGRQPDTLRFMRFNPAAIIGRHQILSDEVNLDYCSKNNIEIVRRITGGGAIYLDPGQLGWELAINRKHLGTGVLGDITKILCEAAASGLSRLGLDVKFRPRNDLEVDGRKISGTGGFFDGDTLFFQGTVLVDMNSDNMIAALNIPAAKLAKHKLKSGGDRVVTVRELLGDKTPSLDVIRNELRDGLCQALGFEFATGEFSQEEYKLAQEYFDDEIGQDDFVYEFDRTTRDEVVSRGTAVTPGGTIIASLKLKGQLMDRVSEIIFHGDLFVSPPRILFDLEAHLKGVLITDISDAVNAFFDNSEINMMSVLPSHFVEALEDALR
jgi:lipoate---protein ligase